MGFDPFAVFNEGPRTTRMILLAVLIMTLPCYCLGFVLLATAPDEPTRSRVPVTTTAPLGVSTSGPALTPTITPFFTWTPTGQPLFPTATQLYLQPTIPQIVYPTFTLTFTPAATWTSIPTNTIAPTLTMIPTNTLAPTQPPPPTEEPLPTEPAVPTTDPAILTQAALTEAAPPAFPTPTQEQN